MGWGSLTVGGAGGGGAGGGRRKLGLCGEGVVRSTQNTQRCPEPGIYSAHVVTLGNGEGQESLAC